MNRLTALFCFTCAAFSATAATALDDAAERMTAASAKQEIAAGDPRVAQARGQLDKAARLTAETPIAVASACSRYVGHLHDSAQIEATPLELLDALVKFGKTGKAMNDTLLDYVAARKAAPKRSHAEAMAALDRK